MCDDLVSKDGKRIGMEHQYFRGEHQFDDYKIDGYAQVDNKHIFFEFLGCYYHACPSCYGGEPDVDWEAKKHYLQEHGILHYIRECKWKFERSRHSYLETPGMPRILKSGGKESEIIEGIENDELYGFCLCDIETPNDVIDEILHLNFPPIIQRMDITEEHLSQYMEGRTTHENTKLPRNTVVQTFNGKQLLLFTPLIKFYMGLGMKISNITKFIQYRPAVALNDFVASITDGRIKAIEDQKKSLGLAFKTVGNRYVFCNINGTRVVQEPKPCSR